MKANYFLALLLGGLLLAGCNRPSEQYRTRLTVPEFTTAFAPKQKLAPPPLEANLITMEIDFARQQIHLFSDLAMEHPFADYSFSISHGFNKFSLVSEGFEGPVPFTVPDDVTIVAPGNIEFKK